MFVEGYATLPEGGMGAIPEQLVESIGMERIVLNTMYVCTLYC